MINRLTVLPEDSTRGFMILRDDAGYQQPKAMPFHHI